MKYKGFVIEPYYSVGSQIREFASGVMVDRKPTQKDIEGYNILDPMENGNRWGAENTISECKETIDRLLEKMGMKSNLPKEWAKLEAPQEGHS